MRESAWAGLFALAMIGAPVALAGCGSATPGGLVTSRERSEPRIMGEAFPQPLQATSEAQAQEIDYRGQRALQLSNGLVTVVALPGAEGRIVSYRLGAFEYLHTSSATAAEQQQNGGRTTEGGEVVRVIESGASPPAPLLAGEGSEALPRPAGEGAAVPPGTSAGGTPAPLTTGAWKGEVLTARGIYAEVELLGPEDKQVGLRLTRLLRLYAGSTRLQVTDTLENTGKQPLKCALETVTQLVGAPDKVAPSGQVRLYLPLTPTREHREGFWSRLNEGDTSQFATGGLGRLLEVAYKGKAGEVAANVRSGWLGYAESSGGHALVRRFIASPTGEYAEGAPVRVRTTEAKAGEAWVELLTASATEEIKAGGVLVLAQDWYATVLPGPIVEASETAAIGEALTLKPEGEGLRLRGRLGVFAPGKVVITLLDASGQRLGEPIAIKATPSAAVVIDQAISGVAGAAAVRLALENASGTPMGDIAQVPLPAPRG